MPTVVFCNRKGGVGKTLSNYYTGRWLARTGRTVELLDLDPQQGLWDIASLVGHADGVFTKRLRLVHSTPPRPGNSRQYLLIDTPPALDGSLPALNQADWLVIPVIPEAQEVAQLAKFLSMPDATRSSRPFTQVLGILSVRFVRRSTVHQIMLRTIAQLADAHGHRVLDPVPQSLAAVTTYSMDGGLWKQVASELIGLEDARAHRAVKVASDDQAFVLNVVENVQRRELSGRERVRPITLLASLTDDDGRSLGVHEIGRRTGLSAATISQWLRIQTKAALRTAVEDERLDIGRAMRLVSVPEDTLDEMIDRAGTLSQQDLGREVAAIIAPGDPPETHRDRQPPAPHARVPAIDARGPRRARPVAPPSSVQALNTSRSLARAQCSSARQDRAADGLQVDRAPVLLGIDQAEPPALLQHAAQGRQVLIGSRDVIRSAFAADGGRVRVVSSGLQSRASASQR